MHQNRRSRLASVIRDEMARVISRELKDPRIPPLAITRVDVADDGSEATLFISALSTLTADDKPVENSSDMKDCIAGLTSASGYLRRQLAEILTIRHIPRLHFKVDNGLENSARVFDLLKTIEKTDVQIKEASKTEDKTETES